MRDNFQFNAMWLTWYMVALVLCWRLAESDVTITLFVTRMGWLCLWYNHMAHPVSSSAALAFLTNMSEEHKSRSPIAIQVKNWRMTIHIKQK